MLGHDPRDFRRWWDAARRDRRPHDPNLDRLLTGGLVAALCLCLGSFAPPPLAAALAAELLRIAALASALEAVLRGQKLTEERLTAWDQAAALLALALLARFAAGPPPEPPG